MWAPPSGSAPSSSPTRLRKGRRSRSEQGGAGWRKCSRASDECGSGPAAACRPRLHRPRPQLAANSLHQHLATHGAHVAQPARPQGSRSLGAAVEITEAGLAPSTPLAAQPPPPQLPRSCAHSRLTGTRCTLFPERWGLPPSWRNAPARRAPARTRGGQGGGAPCGGVKHGGQEGVAGRARPCPSCSVRQERALGDGTSGVSTASRGHGARLATAAR